MRYPDLVGLLRVTALTASLAALAGGCDEPASAGPQTDAAAPRPSASASASAAPSARAAPSASAPATKQPLQLLRMALTSEIKRKEPVDRLEAAEPGQRVWAHLVLRNRASGARKVRVIFRVNGDERSRVDLDVDPSWSYRTWAYNTLRKTDTQGDLTVEVRDDEDGVLTTAKLPIKAHSIKKPPPGKPPDLGPQQ